MTIKSDVWIKKMVESEGLISNFIPEQCKSIDGKGAISFGLSSYGYDMRCSDEFHIVTNYFNDERYVIDPKNNINSLISSCIKHKGTYCIIPSRSYVLTTSIEFIRMPKNVMGICIGKSTYARCGLIVNITPIEAGFCGNITIEISNTSPLPVKIYSNEGIAQILFFESDEQCLTSYADKMGKYQNQTGIEHAKI
jgi:dCTP deaminase